MALVRFPTMMRWLVRPPAPAPPAPRPRPAPRPVPPVPPAPRPRPRPWPGQSCWVRLQKNITQCTHQDVSNTKKPLKQKLVLNVLSSLHHCSQRLPHLLPLRRRRHVLVLRGRALLNEGRRLRHCLDDRGLLGDVETVEELRDVLVLHCRALLDEGR